jgi:tRNA (cmo5U34)-methyltransferase
MNNFDERATTWDTNPMHLQRSIAIAEQLSKRIPFDSKWDALEFGAGTGILGFLLAETLNKVVLMDTSEGMVQVMQQKVTKLSVQNVFPMLHDLTLAPIKKQFDLIFSQMVFHHIPDIPSLLKRLHETLKPGGYLAIADLYSEDGSFHGSGFDGHLGFDPEQLCLQVKSAGFKEVVLETCFVIHKQTEAGTLTFPVFLLTAMR